MLTLALPFKFQDWCNHGTLSGNFMKFEGTLSFYFPQSRVLIDAPLKYNIFHIFNLKMTAFFLFPQLLLLLLLLFWLNLPFLLSM